MLFIRLHNLLFVAYHGCLPEERIAGNQFRVNITLQYMPTTPTIEDLAHTINYAEVYEVVKKRMEQTTPLLETIAMDLCDKLLQQFLLAEHVIVAIEKCKPPIRAMIGSASVCFEKSRQ